MKYKKYFRKTSLKQENIGERFLGEISSKRPKNFLEVGVFHGVTARNVCELLYSIHKDDFRYIGLDLFGESSENISEIILSQIPGISAKTSKVIIDKFGSLYQLLDALNKDQKCMDGICFTTGEGTQRKISKTAIRNVVQYLLYQKSNIIKIDTN